MSTKWIAAAALAALTLFGWLSLGSEVEGRLPYRAVPYEPGGFTAITTAAPAPSATPATEALPAADALGVGPTASALVPEAQWGQSRAQQRLVTAQATVRPTPRPTPEPTPRPTLRPTPAPTARPAAIRPIIRRPAPTHQPTTSSPQSGNWHAAFASSYGIGDGFLGGHLACGGRLDTMTPVVANKTLPCGTRLTICFTRPGWGTNCTAAVVMDRGPYVAGRSFDLGPAVAHRVHFSGLGWIKWREG